MNLKKLKHHFFPKNLPPWGRLSLLAFSAFIITIILEMLAFSTFTVTMVVASNPVLAQSLTSNGFNPQEWLINALQWIDSLGALGAIA